jgi:hypothetical protein
VDNDIAIRNLILHYDNNPKHNDELLLNHLRALQYQLADAGIQGMSL